MVFDIKRVSDEHHSHMYKGEYVYKKPCSKAYTTGDVIELSERDIKEDQFRKDHQEWKEECIIEHLDNCEYDTVKEKYTSSIYGWKIDLQSIMDLQDLMSEVGELIINHISIRIYDDYVE